MSARVLDAIVASKWREIEVLRQQSPPPPAAGHTPIDVAACLSRSPGKPLHLIAEVKLRSPSAGPLSSALPPAERARAYAAAGAHAISVLCDGPFFGGSYEHLAAARRQVQVPLLAKEFVLDEVQLAVARAAGADAVLLIVRLLPGARLAELVAACAAHGLTPLVEVASDAELEVALASPARLIGVNARDLDTLAMDAARATRLVHAIPPDRVALHLSGLKTPADVEAVGRGRADGALVGEVLMREDDPGPLLRELVQAAASQAR